jgi:hypothetical protein
MQSPTSSFPGLPATATLADAPPNAINLFGAATPTDGWRGPSAITTSRSVLVFASGPAPGTKGAPRTSSVLACTVVGPSLGVYNNVSRRHGNYHLQAPASGCRKFVSHCHIGRRPSQCHQSVRCRHPHGRLAWTINHHHQSINPRLCEWASSRN